MARLIGVAGVGVYFLAVTIVEIGATISRLGLESTALRFAAAREGVTLAAETTGKYKMVMQVIAILLLILEGALPTVLNLQLWGTIILLFSMVLSLISAAQYCRQFVDQVLPRWGVGNP